MRVTPSIKPGKPVTSWDKGVGTVGIVRRLVDANYVTVVWPGSTVKRRVQVSRIGVRPIPAEVSVVPPTAAGQQVVGVYGTHNQQRGTVTAVHGLQCTVQWQSGGQSRVAAAHLHVEAPDAEAPASTTADIAPAQVRHLW